jgi:hypothetical protein
MKTRGTLQAAFIALLAFRLAELTADAPRIIDAPVWVYLETVPGAALSAEDPNAAPPLDRLSEVSRFVLGGMVYGWKFSYTPHDKKRAVAEAFTLEPILSIPDDDPRFSIPSLTPEYPRLSCIASYRLDSSHARWATHWDSVLFRTAKGRGTGERARETEGIKDAYTSAVLNAVREHARKLERNKPKEILGEVLLREGPRLFLNQGWFVAEVKVLINVREIVPYRSF